MSKFTIKAAKELCRLLEEHGWTVFNGGEYICSKCKEAIPPNDCVAWAYCPHCGEGLKIDLDAEYYESTARFVADLVNMAREKA